MKPSFRSGFTAFTLALLAFQAHAAPVGIDGLIGAEWSGVSFVNVTHDDNAVESNFGTPANTTKGASYKIGMRGDGSYVYVVLQITGDSAFSAGNFANLYFDTNPGTGSDLGIEVTNGTYFIPGGPGGFDVLPYITYDATSNPGTIEVAIENGFFTSGLQGSPAAVSQVQLRLSQSFGYSVGGGASYGADRLGLASILPALNDVPEPGSMPLALAALGGLAFAARRRN